MRHDDCAILVPTLNEADHITPLLDFIRCEAPNICVIVVDGQSQDRTCDTVENCMAQDPHLFLLKNPDRLQSAGLNMASRKAAAMGKKLMIRMDAHARYPQGFILKALHSMAKGEYALLTGGRDVALPQTPTRWQRWAKRWSMTPLHHIGAPFRRPREAQARSTHGHHIAWQAEVFLESGGYNPYLAAFEDIDLEERLLKSGAIITFDGTIRVGVFPRPQPWGSFKQFFRNGRARVVARGIRAWKSPRLLLPLLASAGFTVVLLTAPLWTMATLIIGVAVWPPIFFGLLALLAFQLGALCAALNKRAWL